MPDLMYVGGTQPEIYSRREGSANKSSRVPKLESLKVGNIIRCSYQNSSDNGIYVLPLIQGFADPVLVTKEV